MSIFPETLESDRLRYEAASPDAVDPYELYEYVNADAPNVDEITRYVTWDPYDHPKVALEWLEHCAEQFDEGESANYIIRPTERERAGELAGMAGVHPKWDRQLALMGTWLRKPFWGQGYSGERAATLLELAFETLDLEIVAVEHDPENEQSKRAIEKYVDRFGGQREGRLRNAVVMNGEPRDTIRYTIAKEEWQEHR